ncbi:MAG TPA: hypothetical protein VIN08_13370 [Ohtaekwangia sp.]|uniref:hypothetical protein n=1 Tax=Ohtaekwangia sp. TaxID=2066019 RepID=UPI002F95B695
MINKAWIALYNCLFLVSSRYREIASLESPIFEIFEDLDTRLIVGLNDESLEIFLKEGWINDGMRRELSQFRDFVNNIDSKYWNAEDFDHLEDWNLAREWAITLMSKLGFKNKGWNSNGETIIYTQGD